MQTVGNILGNILKHPDDAKYYRVNTLNEKFHQK
jgi:hypothetical protein